MNPALEQIVNAVLYEGYILYPYRASSTKNRRERFTFGRVYPEAYSLQQNGAEPCTIQTECLVEADSPQASLQVSVRFLHACAREVGKLVEPGTDGKLSELQCHFVSELRVGPELFQAWLEAIERSVECPRIELCVSGNQNRLVTFCFEPSIRFEPILENSKPVGLIRRRQARVVGFLDVTTQQLKESLYKITVRIQNQSPLPSDAADSDGLLLRTLASTHTILRLEHARFISAMDPGPNFQREADTCLNIGTWPVLVGDESRGERDTMLSSPIILYDYPKIAPESAGPLFDGTEIDEILSLRVLTMTDSEKFEMRQVDEQARRLLERTEALDAKGFLKMHGTVRASQTSAPPVEFDDFFGPATRLHGVSVAGVFLRAGDRVRVQPKGRADLMDLALAGRIAIIEAVEQDLEGKVHLAVIFEDDPGKDLGLMRQPGHRFFFKTEEVEPIQENVV